MVQLTSNKPYSTLISSYPFFDIETLSDFFPEVSDFDLTHIHQMTNNTGILQQAKYAVPNYHQGYCLDDNARGLILATAAGQLQRSFRTKNLISTYLAYIFYMQTDNGKFRNCLSFDHSFLDEEGTEESYGRTIWALGFFARHNTHNEFIYHAQEMFQKGIQHCLRLRSVRAVAYSLLGIMDYYTTYPEEHEMLNYIKFLAEYLKDEYKQHAASGWEWYETIGITDHAILPLSVLKASAILNDEELHTIGMQSSLFLDKLYFKQGFLTIAGNFGLYPQHGVKSVLAQQSTGVSTAILLYKQLYQMTANPLYKKRMMKSFQWFFGGNTLGLKLYDPMTKGCCDGLDSHGVNLNQGAESTISFWLSYVYMCTDID